MLRNTKHDEVYLLNTSKYIRRKLGVYNPRHTNTKIDLREMCCVNVSKCFLVFKGKLRENSLFDKRILRGMLILWDRLR